MPGEPNRGPDRPAIVLASASPRRRDLLHRLGLDFTVQAAEIDERVLDGEDAENHVVRLALTKAEAVAAGHPGALVIGGDTEVVVDGEVLGKPADGDDAVEILMRLQGRDHTVISAVAVVAPEGAADGSRATAARAASVRVRFRSFDRVTARQYVDSGEPLDKAGAYGIQGRGGALVAGIEGDYSAVVGLPLATLVDLVAELGFTYDFTGLRRT